VPKPGDAIGRYVLERLLGEGGMGSVWAAFDPALDRPVAIKLVRMTPGPGSDADEAQARLLREARASARLDHPCIVAVYDVGETEAGAFIAMELLDGVTLRKYVGDDSVPIERRLGWLREIARALAAAHDAGIVHRDVKPENVLVRRDGAIKVVDFGIARRAAVEVDPSAPTSNEALATITTRGAIVGTVPYMAPEQLRGDPLDGRVDQFAWGAMAHELLTGVLPWSARDAVAVVAAISSSDPAPLDPALAAAGPSVATAVERALAKRKEDRFAGMSELIDALSATGPAEPVPAAPAPPAKARPRTLLIGAGIALAASVSLALWADGRRARHAPEAPAPSASAAPVSASPEAARFYADALQRLRGESAMAAARTFEQALALDARMPQANLRFALLVVIDQPGAAREHYAVAVRGAADVDEREAAFIRACAPVFREPADFVGWDTKLADLLAARPRDAEIAFWLAYARWRISRGREAIEACDRALEADPGFASAMWLRGVVEREVLGDETSAVRTAEACLARFPGASMCRGELLTTLAERGDCKALEAAARAWKGAVPDSPGWGFNLAWALHGRGEPLESVEEALLAGVSRLPKTLRATAELRARAHLAAERGDWAEAESKLRAWSKLVEGQDDASVRTHPTIELALLLLETGRAAEAGRVAEDAVRRMGAWSSLGTPPTEETFYADPKLTLVALERAAGRVAQGELDKRREEWLASLPSGPAAAGAVPGFGWLTAYPRFVLDAGDARAALEALPRFPPPATAPLRPPLVDGWVGRVYLLAGRPADALPSLRRAVAACPALEWPIGEHTRLRLALGQALEATHDTAGAREAYRAVVARWGSSTPASASAQIAKKQLATLGDR